MEDLGPPQIINLIRNPVSIFAGEYLKKNYLNMAKQLKKTYECSICLDEIDCVDGCDRCFSLLTCGHIYHIGCLIKVQPMNCPLCRSQPT